MSSQKKEGCDLFMSEVEKLKETLFNKKKCGWDVVEDEEKQEIYKFGDEYIHYLNKCKTERETISFSKQILDENGFMDIANKTELLPGDRVYYINRDKSMYIAVIGTEPMENGLNMVGAHVDSPRIDLKPNPLYEESGYSYFKTHYYGGIKKYQWTAIPLSIRGVIIKANGERIDVNIGEDESEPIFTITDLLPHLAQDQMEKKLKESIAGEDLNLLIGSIPYGKDEKAGDRIKLNTLKLLNEKYGIVEADLISAELQLVPAFAAKSLGFDGSMVAGYGQDDRVCSYATLRAILNVQNPAKTVVCVLVDKEEIGSVRKYRNGIKCI